MFPLKLRKVLQAPDTTSFEYAPVEVVKHHGGWSKFLTFGNDQKTMHTKFVNYVMLEAFVRTELEAIVLECLKEDTLKVAELEINTGDFLIYITVQRGIDTFRECKEAFDVVCMRPPENFKNIFHFSWVNRLDTLTTTSVHRKELAF